VCGLLLVSACSDDDDEEGSAGSHAGTGGSHASDRDSGMHGGSGGKAGSSASGHGGAAGTHAGSGGADSGNSVAMDSGPDEDSGTDAGMTTATGTMCKAPVKAVQSGNECPAGDPPALEVTLIKGGLTYPIFVTQPPNDDSRLFVVQRNGQILLLDPESGDMLGTFMTVPNVADAGGDSGEAGMLGMAFHPDYPTDPRFFVNYTTDDTGLMTIIASFEVAADDPDRGDPDTGVPLVTYMQPQGNHDGGMVAFGPDGCLFVAAGDGGGSNDQHGDTGNGQNLETHLGKILRIDVDNPTERPAGNLEGTSVPHIWDYGVRNPWRFSFDRMSGDLYIGDVGQDNYEEVDVEPKGAGNKNYGWKITEGTHCRPGGDANCDMNDLTEPIVDYPHGNGDDCVVGGYVYRGSAIPGLQGWYLYGDNGAGDGDPANTAGATGRRVRALVWDGEHSCQATPPVVSQLNDFDIAEDITSFGEDSHGELYITTLHSLYRIDKM
jgi:glucose/arabinose dehydrogenase